MANNEVRAVCWLRVNVSSDCFFSGNKFQKRAYVWFGEFYDGLFCGSSGGRFFLLIALVVCQIEI